MRAREYLDEIVLPTIDEYADEPTSKRKGLIACIVLYHFIDYVTYPKPTGLVIKQWRKENPAFRRISDYANATKHVATNREKPDRGVYVGDVISRPAGRCGVMQCGVSRLGDIHGGVTDRKNINIDLLQDLVTAVNYLRSKL